MTTTSAPRVTEGQSEQHYLNCSHGFKSWAFTMVFRSDRTLTGPEVDQAVKTILKSLETSFQAKHR